MGDVRSLWAAGAVRGDGIPGNCIGCSPLGALPSVGPRACCRGSSCSIGVVRAVPHQIAVNAPGTQPFINKLLRIFLRLEALRVHNLFHRLRILVPKDDTEMRTLLPNGSAQRFWHVFAHHAKDRHCCRVAFALRGTKGAAHPTENVRGNLPLAGLRGKHVQAFIDRLSPGKARNFAKLPL